jgi:hypothetical protein
MVMLLVTLKSKLTGLMNHSLILLFMDRVGVEEEVTFAMFPSNEIDTSLSEL